MKIHIGTNTKMYKTIAQTSEYLSELREQIQDIDSSLAEIFVIPSYTTLESASRITEKQIFCWEPRIWAGRMKDSLPEKSPLMLKEVGVRVVEIGHSERRHILHEDDEMINHKVHAALHHGFIPLLCIGETAEQKENGIADEVLKMQIKLGLRDVKQEDAGKIWIAYEPVWAIGVNGKPAGLEYAARRHHVMRKTLEELYDIREAARIPLLYGGSVNLSNACEFMSVKDIDGLFIGRSAWDAKQFDKIIRAVLAAKECRREEILC